MRTRNEKILMAVLVTILFVTGNFFGYKWLAQKQASLQSESAQMVADQAEAKVDLRETGMWTQRKAWLKEHEPALSNEGDAGADVLEAVKKGAVDNKLEIIDQSLKDVQHGSAGTRVNVALKVKGSMQGIVHWLTDLQKPEQFYALSLFSLKADQDQKSMVCTLEIARYFKSKDGS